jgi:NAD(P)-dependent dehydrogenase (short-subunit alcohol dehydrogenase family)
MHVNGRVALVTGSAGGIGKAIALKLAQHGAKVVINDIQQDKIDAAVAEIREAGGEALGIRSDVTNKAEVKSMFERIINVFGNFDILVNNVGIARDALIQKMTEDEWDMVLNINLKSFFLCTQEATKYFMERNYGRIVNISSRAWLGGFGQANYSAAKGGIVSLTRTCAIELAKYNVTANCIAPGIIDTPLFRSFKEEAQERLLKMQPINRIGQPEEVANAAVFFASNDSGYITGQVLHVCGGKSLGAMW